MREPTHSIRKSFWSLTKVLFLLDVINDDALSVYRRCIWQGKNLWGKDAIEISIKDDRASYFEQLENVKKFEYTGDM